jgi:hypothetical protein
MNCQTRKHGRHLNPKRMNVFKRIWNVYYFNDYSHLSDESLDTDTVMGMTMFATTLLTAVCGSSKSTHVFETACMSITMGGVMGMIAHSPRLLVLTTLTAGVACASRMLKN